MTDMHLSDAIRYVGTDDTDIDLFESQYPVPNGVSYNSYVILDEKVAVMDTVDKRRTGEWLEKLEAALAGRKPDYLVIQHLEPDHAGSIGALAERYPDMELVASAKAVQMLPKFYPACPNPTRAVKEGDFCILIKPSSLNSRKTLESDSGLVLSFCAICLWVSFCNSSLFSNTNFLILSLRL